MTGSQFRYGRELRGVSQERLAELLGCHPCTIRRNESRPVITRYMSRLLGESPLGRFWVGALRGRAERRRGARIRAAA